MEAPHPVPALELSSGKRDLVLLRPWVNTPGFLGFAGEARDGASVERLGAFVTPPLSLLPRTLARPPRLRAAQGSFLLHTGHPNPGLPAVLRQHQRAWSDLRVPVIAHLLLQTPDEAAAMAALTEGVESIAALELGLGEVSASQAAAMVQACVGELPLIAHLPLGAPLDVFAAAAEAGVQAVSIGAPRGALPAPDGAPVHGRLYGPAIFPLALQGVVQLASALRVPILAGGGVYAPEQAQALRQAGAAVVVLDGVLWTEPERVLGGEPAET
jgi:dihydroorotate dehydrogenase (NAD+) catalytic subunit